MTAVSFLSFLRDQDVRVSLRGSNLECAGPAQVLTPALHEEIVGRKQELLSLLQQEALKYPLSFAQQRLWFLEQISPGAAAFNLPLVLWLKGSLNRHALEQALCEIARRHQVLRTNYCMADGDLQAAVTCKRLAQLPLVDLRGLPRSRRSTEADRMMREESVRPFDLSRDPVFRPLLLRLDSDEHRLLLTRHHIASDGWSLGLLLTELNSIYEAYCLGRPSILPELLLQYQEFARWERSRLTSSRLEPQLQYWSRQLSGLDTSRNPLGVVLSGRTSAGGIETASLGKPLSLAVLTFSRTRAVSVFDFQLGAFLVLLHHLSGLTDLLVGTDYTHRSLRETEPMIGLFVNRLALRFDLSGDPTFDELLSRVHLTTVAGYANADVPYEQVVALSGVNRSASPEPLICTLFGLHAAPSHAPYRGLRLFRLQENMILECPNPVLQLPLSFYVSHTPSGYLVEMRHDTTLFPPTRAQRILGQFTDILDAAICNSQVRLSALRAILSVQERGAFQHIRRRQWKVRLESK